jgi:hypothetical protein
LGSAPAKRNRTRQEIPFDLQLPDLAMQVVDHGLRVDGLLVAAFEQVLGVLYQRLLSSADHRRMYTVLRRQFRQRFVSRQGRHCYLRLEFRTVLLTL